MTNAPLVFTPEATRMLEARHDGELSGSEILKRLPCVQKEEREAKLEAELKAYMLSTDLGERVFRFGGVPNLAYTLGKIALQIATETGCPDYAKASAEFFKVEQALDGLRFEVIA